MNFADKWEIELSNYVYKNGKCFLYEHPWLEFLSMKPVKSYDLSVHKELLHSSSYKDSRCSYKRFGAKWLLSYWNDLRKALWSIRRVLEGFMK